MPRPKPTLFFTPYAWAKLIFMRDYGDTEIAGFGVAHDQDHLLYIHDFITLPQLANPAHFEIDDDAIGDFATEMILEHNLPPAQTTRINIHTHPGNCPHPSSYDEDEFADNFKGSSFAVMGILARGGQTYARLKVNDPFTYEVEIDMKVDWAGPFQASDRAAWKDEYMKNVKKEIVVPVSGYTGTYGGYSSNRLFEQHKTNGPAKQVKKNQAAKASSTSSKSEYFDPIIHYEFPFDLTTLDLEELEGVGYWAIAHDQDALLDQTMIAETIVKQEELDAEMKAHMDNQLALEEEASLIIDVEEAGYITVIEAENLTKEEIANLVAQRKQEEDYDLRACRETLQQGATVDTP